MTPQEELDRADRARRILEDDIFRDAIQQMEQALLGGICRAGIADDRLRDKLAVRYAVLQDLVACLKTTMETGKLAAHQLSMDEAQRSLKERVAKYIGF